MCVVVFYFFCCCCDSDCAFFVSLKNELYGCISLCNSHYIQIKFFWIELNWIFSVANEPQPLGLLGPTYCTVLIDRLIVHFCCTASLNIGARLPLHISSSDSVKRIILFIGLIFRESGFLFTIQIMCMVSISWKYSTVKSKSLTRRL